MKIKMRVEDAAEIVSGCTAQEIIDSLSGYVEKYEQYGPIEMYIYGSYDVEIEYRSPESESDIDEQLRLEAQIETKERAEYERLKAKYDDAE